MLATPRGHTIIAGEAHGSVHAGVGFGSTAAALAGLELNGRISNDYGHGSLGASFGVLGGGERFIAHARASFIPFGLSSRDAIAWYSLGGSLDLTAGFVLSGGRSTDFLIVRNATRSAVTASLRMDVDFRPGRPEADLWFALLLGFHYSSVTGR